MMSPWMDSLLVSAWSATLLAVVVALVASRVRRPAIVHALWLLVLLKLVIPPVVEWNVLPHRMHPLRLPSSEDRRVAALPSTGGVIERAPAEQDRAAPAQRDKWFPASSQGDDPAGAAAVAAPSARPGALQLLSALALAGTVVLLALSLVSLLRFRHRIRRAPEAPAAMQQRVAHLARVFGVSHPPRVRLVDDSLSPSLRPGPGRSEILFPAGLLTRLSEDECDAILAHELAHLRRRDHWLRPVELVVVALYWWHPVAWWARRNLRVAEELSCDALVVHHLGDRSRTYAEGLLKTVEFLACPKPAVPLLATGATGMARLKERVTMILKKNSPDPPSRRLQVPLYAALSLLLVVSPGWVEKAASKDGADSPNPEAVHQRQLLEIQQRELQLQRDMQRLELERMSVRMQIEEKRMQQRRDTLLGEIAAREREGRQEEAQALRQEVLQLETETALHREQWEAEQVLDKKRMEFELQQQELQLRMRAAELDGNLEELRQLSEKQFDLQRGIRQLEIDAMQGELERNRVRLEAERKQLESMRPESTRPETKQPESKRPDSKQS